jgi:hypothetical protein
MISSMDGTKVDLGTLKVGQNLIWEVVGLEKFWGQVGTLIFVANLLGKLKN